ncbi:MAG TPA: butyrate kinase [Myxococcota bacterium]|nr:butyrate kinase [Myxococcota bacterium]HRY92856.1 butyrate kinase [Myxococcota bacterium]HSA21226.1 butyrate kinase [Myxococcota bacterium]
MDWTQLRQRIQEGTELRRALQAAGDALTSEFEGLLAACRPGEEDPVLVRLLGPDLSALVRKVRWSSLVLNPGSTSTKVTVYNGLVLLASDELRVEAGAPDGLEERVAQVAGWLESSGLNLLEVTGIAARGGLMAPVASGTYRISERMLEDLAHAAVSHASNLGVPMALKLGERIGPDVVLTTTDPVTVDELEPAERLTGSARIRNDGTPVHYLNQRAVAELVAQTLGARRSELHLVTCHMGGGMSAARHLDGRMLAVSHGFGGMPSANRSGALPLQHILRLMESHSYSLDDLRRDVTSAGGLVALAGTHDFKALFEFAERGASPAQQEKIRLVTEFFVARIAGCILSLSAAERPLDLVVLTGGLARAADFCRRIAARLPLPVPVARVPGSVEQSALAAGLLKACAEQEARQTYVEVRDRLAIERERLEAVAEVPIFGGADPARRELRAPSRLDEVVRAAATGASPTIALVGADCDEALLAIKEATEQPDGPMARFLLLGPYAAVSQLAWELDVPIDDQNIAIVDTANPVATATELLVAGLADTVMKGNATTAEVLKGYLGYLKARGLTGPHLRLSHLGFFEIPGRPKLVAVTDAAMNTSPDVPAREAILENALGAMHLLGFRKPKVAVISAVEKPSKAVLSSLEGQEIAQAFQGREDVIIEGPLSVDLALSPSSAHEKRYPGRIQGDADVLLVPDIDAGNAIYKAFTVTSGATTAGVIIGGESPIILTSRGDSARSKLCSIALAVLLINLRQAGRQS